MSQLPIYPWFDQVPDDLKTRKQLAELGLRPGGPVVARVVWRRGERWADLYDVKTAVPKRPATPAQLAALAKAHEKQRTCPGCKTVFSFVLGWRDIEHCPVCEQGAREADRAEAAATASGWLADPRAVVLDTETTDLDGFLVEIAVIDMAGVVLLDTLVNPQAPISAGARAVHGITDEMVAGAPTFADIGKQLETLLQGRTVVTYNAAFDRDILWHEAYRLLSARPVVAESPERRSQRLDKQSRAWVKQMRWECAMEVYAAFCGDWSEYHGNYRWQPLGGGHRALGDAQACLEVIRHMAAEAPPGAPP